MTIPLTEQLRTAADDEVRVMPGWATRLLRAAADHIEQLEAEAEMLRTRVANDEIRLRDVTIDKGRAESGAERLLQIAGENGAARDDARRSMRQALTDIEGIARDALGTHL